jgi:hypothetical protein
MKPDKIKNYRIIFYPLFYVFSYMILNLGRKWLNCCHKRLIIYSYEYCSLHDLWRHIVIINQGQEGATFGKSRSMDDCGDEQK